MDAAGVGLAHHHAVLGGLLHSSHLNAGGLRPCPVLLHLGRVLCYTSAAVRQTLKGCTALHSQLRTGQVKAGPGEGSVRPGPYQNGALLAVVPVELHHGLEREVADHVTVEDEERVCGLREQVPGQGQGPSCGGEQVTIFLGVGALDPGSAGPIQGGPHPFPALNPPPQGVSPLY